MKLSLSAGELILRLQWLLQNYKSYTVFFWCLDICNKLVNIQINRIRCDQWEVRGILCCWQRRGFVQGSMCSDDRSGHERWILVPGISVDNQKIDVRVFPSLVSRAGTKMFPGRFSWICALEGYRSLWSIGDMFQGQCVRVCVEGGYCWGRGPGTRPLSVCNRFGDAIRHSKESDIFERIRAWGLDDWSPLGM